MMNIFTASKPFLFKPQTLRRPSTLRTLVALHCRVFSNDTNSSSSSSLFSKRLKDLRQQIKDTDNQAQKGQGTRVPHASANDFDSYYGTPSSSNAQGSEFRSTDIMRPELIYTMDLDGVLGAMRRVRSEQLPRQSNEFYHACLDRVDQLITERNSRVNKGDLINILRELSHFRPKEEDQKQKMRKE